MGLFSRSNSHKSHHSHQGKNGIAKVKGLEPIAPVPRNDSKGDLTQASSAYFDIGVYSDCNARYRRTMEDSSVVILDFMGQKGCAYFGIYDGHAGSQCANSVAENLHYIVAETISAQPAQKDIPLALSISFQKMDEQLRTMDIKHSGSTAVVGIACYMNNNGEIVPPSRNDPVPQRKLFVANVGDSRAVLGSLLSKQPVTDPRPNEEHNLSATDTSEESSEREAAQSQPPIDALKEDCASTKTVPDAEPMGVIETKRLSYDHRCNDIYEQRRVSNAGGIMINNRVNGMLAVTRSLGDLFMKDYVVGAPYTTETDLVEGSDDILVMACDGLWDVCSDEKSLELAYAAIKEGKSALIASQDLLGYALAEFSVDNLTVMVVRFKSP